MRLKDFPLSITVAACVVGAALVANVFAAPKERPGRAIDLGEARAADEKRFAAADADGDGRVSADEFAAIDPRRLFADMRPDGDRQRRGDGRVRPRTESRVRPRTESRVRPRTESRGAGREAMRERMRERMEQRRAAVAERRQEIRAREFDTADADGDGQLSAEEYKDMPANLKAAQQRSVFERLDTNSDDMLSPEEFPRVAVRLQALDADGDGLVTRKEMRGRRSR